MSPNILGGFDPTTLSANDWLTLILSATALIVSIVATFIGLRLQRREMRIAVRDQMTSVVQNLITTQAELNLLSADPAADAEANFEKSRTLNHKLTSLARQAMELDKIEQSVAFDVELIAIANALWTNGDRVMAERFFRRATEEGPSDFYRSVNLRMYGGYLYQNGQAERARRVYETAMACLTCQDDVDRLNCADVYQEWLDHERRQPSSPNAQAEACYLSARRLLESVADAVTRDRALSDLQARWQGAGFADGGAPPGPPPPIGVSPV